MKTLIFKKKQQKEKPESVTNFFYSLLSLLVSLGVFAILQNFYPDRTQDNLLLVFGVLATVLMFMNFVFRKAYGSDDAGLDFSRFTPSYARVSLKLVAFLFTIGCIAFAYWLFPEYHGSFYDPYWYFLRVVGVIIFLLAFPYFLLIDGVEKDPEDSYLHLGRVLTLRERPDWRILRTHFGGWIIKGFFLPLMVVYMNGNAVNAINSFSNMTSSSNWFLPAYDFAFNGIFFIDVLYTVVGYTLTLRLFGTHIRSVQPTTLGWVVTLMCYQPFWSYFSSSYFAYGSNFEWGTWLRPYPSLVILWGSLIVLFMLIYVASTVSFGQRFSNLTHRGIITGGTYRFSKHPAYISKNITWWLISIPFVPHLGLAHALEACVLLAGVNTIYYLRARTEEIHLRADPVYQKYAEWIEEHGIIAHIKRGTRRLFSPIHG